MQKTASEVRISDWSSDVCSSDLYVMAGLPARHVPLVDADRRLRDADWAYWAGAPERAHDEMAGKTIGLLGFGHIGKAVAARAKAFEMTVHVANRSVVPASPLVDREFTLDDLPSFWRSADVFVVSVPLTEETRGIVGTSAFSALRPHDRKRTRLNYRPS